MSVARVAATAATAATLAALTVVTALAVLTEAAAIAPSVTAGGPGPASVGRLVLPRLEEPAPGSRFAAHESPAGLAEHARPMSDSPTGTLRATYLPAALRDARYPVRHPRPDLADLVWRVVTRTLQAHPLKIAFPTLVDPPSRDGARAAVEDGCHDFPVVVDVEELFGPGAHARACRAWVAGYLGLFHVARARREGSADDLAWAGFFLDGALDAQADLLYGPDESPTGVGFRDSLAAIWQNPMRAADIVVLAELLDQAGALSSERRERVEEQVSGIVRAWHSGFWGVGHHPTTDVPFTTRAAPEASARSLAGHPVMPHLSWTFRWRADAGNSPAEEVVGMGAGAMLGARFISGRLADAEAERLYEAGRHYVDYAIAFDRHDPVHGHAVRTLNAEAVPGKYGQRLYWLENHVADQPAIDYLAATWTGIQLALFGSDLGGQRPWPSLAPDERIWSVLLASAEETLHSADGDFLIDLSEDGGGGYAMDGRPEWVQDCAEGRPGRLFVRYDGRAGGPPMVVSEIGQSGALQLVAVSVPLLRLTADRRAHAEHALWESRLRRALVAIDRHPPNPGTALCKVAPYLSANRGYHLSRSLATLVQAWLGLEGFSMAAR